jgi:hypothetical protein
MDTTNNSEKPSDFSLISGGPLFQLLRRAHLSGDALELLYRRILVVSLVTWLPLLCLSVLDGHALGAAVKIPFLYDIETHVRFLVALPALIACELIVHLRIGPAVRQFEERGIVVKEEIPKFNTNIGSAMRMRNSVVLEAALLILAYSIGSWTWLIHIAPGAATWYAMKEGTHLHLTPAGCWYAFVSIPIFRFMLLRWYARLFLWIWFLWRASKLKLRLTPTDPDRTGGLSFLGNSSYAFGLLLFAQGALIAGYISNRIVFGGQKLWDFRMDAPGAVVFLVLIVLGPLTIFTPHLARTKRQGLHEYGRLVSRFVQEFQDKWIRQELPDSAELMGNPDYSALADIGNAYSVIGEMRLVPFSLKTVTRLVAATAAPMLPLPLIAIPIEQLITRILQILL